jgi:hypothetical protein
MSQVRGWGLPCFVLQRSSEEGYTGVGNILRKKCRLNEITIDIANSIRRDFKKMPFSVYENEILLNIGWEIGCVWAEFHPLPRIGFSEFK